MPPKKKAAASAPAQAEDDDWHSDSSEEMSDPDDDIDEDEEAQILAGFECVRDAARERLAPRTRTQYDMFMGLMARFFTSQPELQRIAVGNTCTLPLPVGAVARYLDYVEGKSVQYKAGLFKPVSTSYYSAVVRSIHDAYVCGQMDMEPALRLLMFSRQKKYKRHIAELKAKGAYPQPPNRCISGQGYTLLCESLAKGKPAEDGGWAWQLVACVWSYVVLLWCLLARCDRVAQLRWENFSWTCDALTVYIPKSKSDQFGDRAYLKKLYTSNNPATCPVLAIAVLFFSRDHGRSEFLFPRADTRRAGLRQLTRLTTAFFSEHDWALFGCNPLHIAWHHFKRGGMTFLSAMMDGPTHAAVKIRADQTVMDVSKFYIVQSTGQDGYIGRLLAMLPYGEPSFTQQEYSLPPATAIQWPTLVPDYDSLPQAFKYEVLPKLFATAVKHQQWLRTTLAPGHPLLASELFTIHDALLRGAISHVHAQQRPMGQCTGLPLSLQTHLLVRASMQSAPTPGTAAMQVPPQAPCASAPLWLDDVAASKPHDVSMRALYPLPHGYVLPKLAIAQCWRAWWTDTPMSPMPLRFVAGKLKTASEKVRYSRYKSIVKLVQSAMPADVCESNIANAFKRGWTSLEMYLRLQHNINIDADAAPSTLYETVCRLGEAFKPPVLSQLVAAHNGNPRPLEEVLREHLHVLAAAETSAGASAGRQNVLVAQLTSALQPQTKRGRPQTARLPPAPPPIVNTPTPQSLSPQQFKCCCGLVCASQFELKRHHNGIGGKKPRNPVHECTAGCTFATRAYKHN